VCHQAEFGSFRSNPMDVGGAKKFGNAVRCDGGDSDHLEKRPFTQVLTRQITETFDDSRFAYRGH